MANITGGVDPYAVDKSIFCKDVSYITLQTQNGFS